MRINIFYRKKAKDRHSIEKVYDTLTPFLSNFKIIKLEMPYRSKGLVKRIGNIFYTAINQATINHVSGDVNYITLLMKKRNTILTIHDIYPIHRTKGLRKWLLQYFWFSLPIKKSAKIITVSNFSKNEIITHFKVNPNKIKVIYNCISPQFKFNKHSFNKTSPSILHMGTKDNKNLDNLIEAVNGLKAKLIIVGEVNSTQVEKLKNYTIDYENVNNISEGELIRLYQKCDILSLVSTYEGFGLPIIEAQAIGRVVITSNLASMPEIAGDGACLVNPFSIEEIRDGILKLINNTQLREDLVLKGLENIKRFEPKKIARIYSHVYKELLNTNIS